LIPILTYQSLEHILADLYRDGYVIRAKPREINWMEPPPLQSLGNGGEMASFRKYKDLWYQGAAHQQLTKSLSSCNPKKVIGLAAGSFLGDWSEASCFQHAAVYSVAHEFGIKAYCQEPVYSATDKELLSQLDISVLENPDGFLEIDQYSIVLCIAPSAPVNQIIADDEKYWPMAIIWNRIHSLEEEMVIFQPPPYPK
jgi:hypothetical protein